MYTSLALAHPFEDNGSTRCCIYVSSALSTQYKYLCTSVLYRYIFDPLPRIKIKDNIIFTDTTRSSEVVDYVANYVEL